MSIIDNGKAMRRISKAAGVLLLCATDYLGVARADQLGNHWQVKPELSLTGIANYQHRGNVSMSHDTIAATAELTIYPATRPYYGGLFVDYRYSSSRRFDDNLNLGGYFRYNLSRWDTTAWLFVNQSPANSETWLYATRLRYRVARNYKLGIEAMAPVDHADDANLMLGYYGSVSNSLSLNILAGAATKGTAELTARIELSWQIR